MDPSVITLTTDFGTRDHYVATMKAVLLARVPRAQLIDVTHELPRHEILPASFTLERAVSIFPPGTIHLAVVDPGVGSARRILVAEVRSQIVICPDNGLITWPIRCHPDSTRTYELTWRPAASSHVFHGRDVMAPAAAQFAMRTPLTQLSRPIDDPVLLPVAPAIGPRGQVIRVDHFGNCTTNIPSHILPATPFTVRAAGHDLGALRHTYSDVPPGSPLALIGSSELLEIAVNTGSAADRLGLRVGTEVTADGPAAGDR